MDIPYEIDKYNRTKRQEGEPVMTQKRLAELAGVRPETVTRHVKGWTGITLETEAKYREVLGIEADAA
jgi:plasmid maintenance system antidote protein VapI